MGIKPWLAAASPLLVGAAAVWAMLCWAASSPDLVLDLAAFLSLVLLSAAPSVLPVALLAVLGRRREKVKQRSKDRSQASSRLQLLVTALAVVTLLWMAILAVMFWLAALLPLAFAALAGYRRLSGIVRGSYPPGNQQQIVLDASSWCLLVNGSWASGLLVSGLLALWM